MEVGDVVFFKKENSWISKTIARLTKSEYTHVGLVVDRGVIIESNRFVDTRVVSSFVIEQERHTLYRSPHITKDIQERVKEMAMHFNGMPYDYLQIVQFVFRLLFKWDVSFLNRSTHLICSELIDYTFIASGLKRAHTNRIGDVMVSELIELYDLKEVITCPER